MYEFDLIANKHPQNRMHTNKGEREGKGRGEEAGEEEKRQSMTEKQKEISVEEKFHYPLFW